MFDCQTVLYAAFQAFLLILPQEYAAKQIARLKAERDRDRAIIEDLFKPPASINRDALKRMLQEMKRERNESRPSKP